MHTRCFTFVYLNFVSVFLKEKRERRGKNCAEIDKEVIQYKTLNSQLILIRCGKIQEDGHGPYRLPESQFHTLNQRAI